MKVPVAYLLASKPRGTLYVGVTSDLVRRVWQHRAGLTDGFSKRYGVKTLVWYEQHPTMLGAIAREKAIKKWERRWKLELIEAANPEWRDLRTEIIGGSARPVIPAQPGVHLRAGAVDSRLRGNDDL